jgi:hypothetical protein
MTLRQVTPLDDHLIYAETSQGAEGVFHVKPYLDSEAFAPLRDKAEFLPSATAGILLSGHAAQTYLLTQLQHACAPAPQATPSHCTSPSACCRAAADLAARQHLPDSS